MVRKSLLTSIFCITLCVELHFHLYNYPFSENDILFSLVDAYSWQSALKLDSLH